MGKSYPGALTEGTQHRRGKGAEQSTVRSLALLGGELAHWRQMGVSVSSRHVCRTIRSKRGSVPGSHQEPLISNLHSKRPWTPVRGCLVEAIDERLFRTKVKRRKAAAMGKVASGTESPISVGIADVLTTGLTQSLVILPREVCWVPRLW
jgi:hypothetical protein